MWRQCFGVFILLLAHESGGFDGVVGLAGVTLGQTKKEIKRALRRHLGGDSAVAVITIVRALPRNRVEIIPIFQNLEHLTKGARLHVAPEVVYQLARDGKDKALEKFRKKCYTMYIKDGFPPEEIPAVLHPAPSKDETAAQRISAYVS